MAAAEIGPGTAHSDAVRFDMGQSLDRTDTNSPAEGGAPSAATTIRRDDRAHYDRATIDAILDAGTIAHVGLVAADGRPVVIPMLYARDGDRVLIHGAPAARLLRAGKGGTDLCLTVTLLDGLVLARSAFHHSLNFRSVVLFGRATPVADLTERARALDRFTDHLLPGRLPTLRPMTDNEVRGTLVLAVPIAEASAKIRTGDPVDEPADLDHPVWAGVLPVRLTPGVPVPSADLRPGIDVPPDVSGWTR